MGGTSKSSILDWDFPLWPTIWGTPMTMETPRNDGWICLDNRKNRQKYRILCVIPTVAAMEYVLIYSYSLSDILSAYYLTLRLTFLQGILSDFYLTFWHSVYTTFWHSVYTTFYLCAGAAHCPSSVSPHFSFTNRTSAGTVRKSCYLLRHEVSELWVKCADHKEAPNSIPTQSGSREWKFPATGTAVQHWSIRVQKARASQQSLSDLIQSVGPGPLEDVVCQPHLVLNILSPWPNLY